MIQKLGSVRLFAGILCYNRHAQTPELSRLSFASVARDPRFSLAHPFGERAHGRTVRFFANLPTYRVSWRTDAARQPANRRARRHPRATCLTRYLRTYSHHNSKKLPSPYHTCLMPAKWRMTIASFAISRIDPADSPKRRHQPPPTTHYPLSTVHCPLSTIHYPLCSKETPCIHKDGDTSS